MKISFDKKFFEKKKAENKLINRHFQAALKDLKIASRDKEPEVIFVFSYSALIKTGIVLALSMGHRVRSRQGHHIVVIEKLAQILGEKDIEAIGNIMRKKRNLDLYEGGIIISAEEAKDYLEFVGEIVSKAEKYLKSQNSLF